MYKVLFEIETKAKTVEGINKAIENATSEKDWFQDDADLQKQVNEGFVELKNDRVIIYADWG